MTKTTELQQESEPLLQTFTTEQIASNNAISSPQVQKGFWACLRNLLKALCSRKKQVSAQRKKSAQEWRDEIQSKNPFWGGGF